MMELFGVLLVVMAVSLFFAIASPAAEPAKVPPNAANADAPMKL